MATHDYVIDNSTGANVRADINNVLQAILTNNSSSSSPSTTAAYMFWADTTTGILKIRNSSNNAWVELLQLDGTLTLEDGTVSAPGLAFRDDLNTGIFSSAADTFNVATGGTERMELGATTIFNEDGEDVDFRIEGDTKTNLFYVNAGTDRVGINTDTPLGHLGVAAAAGTSGTTASAGYDEFVIEGGNEAIGMCFLSPAANNCTQRIAFGDSNNNKSGLIAYEHGNDAFAFDTGGSERMRIDSSGNLFVGASSYGGGGSTPKFYISTTSDRAVKIHNTNTATCSLQLTNAFSGQGDDNGLQIAMLSNGEGLIHNVESAALRFSTNSLERLRIEGDGDIGLATSSPNGSGFAGPIVSIGKSANPYSVLELQGNQTSDGAFAVIAGFNSGGSTRAGQLVFSRNNANNEGIVLIECARSGALAEVARFTNTSDEKRIIVGGTDETNTAGESSWMGLKLKGARPYLVFHEDDRSGEAQHGFVAHTTGALFVAKMAGRIAFSASDSGAPTEIINMQAGNVGLRVGAGGTTSTFDEMRLHSGTGREGIIQRLDGSNVFTSSNQGIFRVNRCSTDGVLMTFIQDGSSEGSINVSGGTVSYNGGHLSRWSQLSGISSTDKSKRPTIYQGTVMSNLDELCSWTHADVLYEEDVLYTSADTIPEGKEIGDIKHAKGDVLRAGYTEENQQLNITKVSDVEGDKDVAGVFWAWDDDDDEIVNDFYVAMTGDMVIRVAASTTVARGDLLISAGDGTAKPQADDIVRSSTIAKIISTNHTATYADGSKAYPCVLMAC